jgi:undecaprenyl-diphosphatase
MRADRRWLLVSAAGLALFLAIFADLAFHGQLAQRDGSFGVAARAWSGPWLSLAALLAAVGSAWVVVPVLAIFVAFLVWRRRLRDALLVVLAAAAEEATTQIVKLLVARERPLGAAVSAGGFSFPSGHAAAAAMLATLLAWYAVTSMRARWQIVALLSLGALWALLMAWSRLALGVHYLTDVLAGLGLGVAVSAAVLSLRRP